MTRRQKTKRQRVSAYTWFRWYKNGQHNPDNGTGKPFSKWKQKQAKKLPNK